MNLKTIILFNIIAISFNSCKTLNLYEKVPIGKFSIKGDLYYEELELKTDSSFNLIINEAHTRDNCQGEWKIESKNKLILNGLNTKKSLGIDSLYYKKLNCENLVLIFKNKRTIKRRNYFLKKK